VGKTRKRKKKRFAKNYVGKSKGGKKRQTKGDCSTDDGFNEPPDADGQGTYAIRNKGRDVIPGRTESQKIAEGGGGEMAGKAMRAASGKVNCKKKFNPVDAVNNQPQKWFTLKRSKTLSGFEESCCWRERGAREHIVGGNEEKIPTGKTVVAYNQKEAWV